MENIIKHINLEQWNEALDILHKSKMLDDYVIDGNNILHIACIRGKKAPIIKILAYGANISISNEDGNNMLHLLLKYAWDSIVNDLLELNSDICDSLLVLLSNINNDGETPLLLCVDRFDQLDRLLKIMFKKLPISTCKSILE